MGVLPPESPSAAGVSIPLTAAVAAPVPYVLIPRTETLAVQTTNGPHSDHT